MRPRDEIRNSREVTIPSVHQAPQGLSVCCSLNLPPDVYSLRMHPFHPAQRYTGRERREGTGKVDAGPSSSCWFRSQSTTAQDSEATFGVMVEGCQIRHGAHKLPPRRIIFILLLGDEVGIPAAKRPLSETCVYPSRSYPIFFLDLISPSSSFLFPPLAISVQMSFASFSMMFTLQTDENWRVIHFFLAILWYQFHSSFQYLSLTKPYNSKYYLCYHVLCCLRHAFLVCFSINGAYLFHYSLLVATPETYDLVN